MDEVFKRGERVKLPVVIKNRCRQKPPNCLHLMILEAYLGLLMWKQGKLFDESYWTNCDGVNVSVIFVAKMMTYKIFEVFCSECVADLSKMFQF